MNRADLQHLVFLAGCDPPYLARLLAEPAGPLWEGLSRDAFCRQHAQLASQLNDDGIRHLLNLRLLSEYLLHPADRPEWLGGWIARNLDVAEFVGPLDWGQAQAGTWCAVALALIGDAGRLRWFIAGLLPETANISLLPTASQGLLDEDAHAAIANAAAAACRLKHGSFQKRLFCFPLVAPQTRLTGRSLGLPLALAFSRLLGEAQTDGCLATGAVDPEGRIHPVGNLAEKFSLAAGNGFQLFLHPYQNSVLNAATEVETLPVATLDEACMFAALHTPRHAPDLVRLKAALTSGRDFIRDFSTLPPQYLGWALRRGRLGGILAEIASSAPLFRTLSAELRRCQAAGAVRSIEHLAAGFPADRLDALSGEAPLAVFDWCCAGLWAANRSGGVARARTWAARAETFMTLVPHADIGATAGFACMLLLGRHNRFRFDPQLPAAVKDVLQKLESIHDAERAGGTRVNLPLGRLYGTICQNCGFCGPRWLEHTEHYAALAQKALGKGSAPDYRNEWLRQDNHLAYAYLDAGKNDEALACLLRYLQADRLEDLRLRRDTLSGWQHALLARFLADTQATDESRGYPAWALNKGNGRVRPRHPWQLWLYNLGRLCLAAGDSDGARSLFVRSLEICAGKESGATLQVMALLPLAGLRQTGRLEPVHEALFEKTRKAAVSLNPRHFADLKNGDSEAALERLWQRADRYFPFAYR